MALSMTKTINVVNQSVVFQNAYASVQSINGAKNEMNAFVQTSVEKNGAVIDVLVFKFPYSYESNKNVIQQAYEHLKTLPEFANATDC